MSFDAVAFETAERSGGSWRHRLAVAAKARRFRPSVHHGADRQHVHVIIAVAVGWVGLALVAFFLQRAAPNALASPQWALMVRVVFGVTVAVLTAVWCWHASGRAATRVAAATCLAVVAFLAATVAHPPAPVVATWREVAAHAVGLVALLAATTALLLPTTPDFRRGRVRLMISGVALAYVAMALTGSLWFVMSSETWTARYAEAFGYLTSFLVPLASLVIAWEVAVAAKAVSHTSRSIADRLGGGVGPTALVAVHALLLLTALTPWDPLRLRSVWTSAGSAGIASWLVGLVVAGAIVTLSHGSGGRERWVIPLALLVAAPSVVVLGRMLATSTPSVVRVWEPSLFRPTVMGWAMVVGAAIAVAAAVARWVSGQWRVDIGAATALALATCPFVLRLAPLSMEGRAAGLMHSRTPELEWLPAWTAALVLTPWVSRAVRRSATAPAERSAAETAVVVVLTSLGAVGAMGIIVDTMASAVSSQPPGRVVLEVGAMLSPPALLLDVGLIVATMWGWRSGRLTSSSARALVLVASVAILRLSGWFSLPGELFGQPYIGPVLLVAPALVWRLAFDAEDLNATSRGSSHALRELALMTTMVVLAIAPYVVGTQFEVPRWDAGTGMALQEGVLFVVLAAALASRSDRQLRRTRQPRGGPGHREADGLRPPGHL